MWIILTREQAEAIRGKHGVYSELYPIELIDGSYGLPPEVLTDEDLDDVRDYLSSLPVEDKEVKEEDIIVE